MSESAPHSLLCCKLPPVLGMIWAQPKGRLIAVVSGLVTLGACSSGGGEQPDGAGTELTCAWLAGDNCWKQLLTDVAGCIDSAVGTLSANRTSCTYASGTVVTFTTPVPAQAGDVDWNFEIKNGSNLCVGVHEVGNNFTVQARTGSFIDEVVGSGTQITCPDGSRYQTSNTVGLLTSCGTAGFPLRISNVGATDASYSLGITEDSSRTVLLFSRAS